MCSIAELEKSWLTEDQLEIGDHERFSHYVPKDKILESALTGKPVRATMRQEVDPRGATPRKFPVCPECKKVYERLRDK